MPHRTCYCPPSALWLLAIVAAALGATPATAQVAGGPKSVPSLGYYAAQNELYAGHYSDALKTFTSESRGAIKTVSSSWIDSICYRAMLGECYYHMGQYPQAVEHYNAALQLYLAFPDWMLRVQFPATIAPDTSRARRQIPWGQSTRQFKLGRVPNTMPIAQGQVNNNDVVQQGGVVQKAVLYPISVQEIVRCTALALRRRAELMGPICKHDPLTDEVLSKLARRPVPRNHWSEAWIDLQLGLAQVGAGKVAEAQQSLTRAIVLAGEYDHPLTATALLELGRLALDMGDFNAAGRLFLEAATSAIYYDDTAVLDEALRLGLEAHLRANRQDAYAPLALASRWARTSRLRHVQAWIGVLTAENHLALNQVPQATTALSEARGLMGRRDMSAAMVGCRLNYLTAQAAFQRGRPDEATAPLAAALDFLRHGSRWLYQISLADNLFTSGTVSPRTAMEIYREVLRDPSPADWTSQPMESLAVLAVPHAGSFENWFQVALLRNEPATALEIADRTRRHRFYNALPMWGRLLSLRKVLETPPVELPQQVAIQRQDLLVRYPAYNQLAQHAAELRGKLRVEPLVAQNEQAAREQIDALNELAKISSSQELLLRQMALRREPADLVFPPVYDTLDVQKSLGAGQFALVFYQARRGLYGFLISNERYATWQIKSPASLQRSLVQLLRDMGHYDQNRELSLEDLRSVQWKTSAREVTRVLFEDSKIDLSRGIDELIIVPDGMLWYLPFEAIPLGGDDDAPPLLSKIRVRYVPTLSLATPDKTPRGRGANLGVVVGKLFPNDKEEVARAALAKVQQSIPEAVALPAPLPAPSNIYRARIDRLIVLDDISIEPERPFNWVPLNLDRGRTSANLASWLTLPWGYPDQVILPGFHTSAESSLRRRPGAPAGSEVFMTACTLMSGGTRTLLLSRWRPGGETTIDLVQQFVQELPYMTAAQAWQRSVELAKERVINWEQEPRVKRFESDTPLMANNPFFWSGYLLIDTGAAPRNDDAPQPAAAPPVLDFNKLKEQQAGDQPAAAEGAAPAAPAPAPADEEVVEEVEEVEVVEEVE